MRYFLVFLLTPKCSYTPEGWWLGWFLWSVAGEGGCPEKRPNYIQNQLMDSINREPKHEPSPACPPRCAASWPPVSRQQHFLCLVRRPLRGNWGHLPADWCNHTDKELCDLPVQKKQNNLERHSASGFSSYLVWCLPTFTASTVALKTGLLCLTLLQNLGLPGLVRLQPYFSRILKALTSLLKDMRTWQVEFNAGCVITQILLSLWCPNIDILFMSEFGCFLPSSGKIWHWLGNVHTDVWWQLTFTSWELFPSVFSLRIVSTSMCWYFSDRGREVLAMVRTSVLTSWADPEMDRTDCAFLRISSISTEEGLLHITATQSAFIPFISYYNHSQFQDVYQIL